MGESSLDLKESLKILKNKEMGRNLEANVIFESICPSDKKNNKNM